MELKKNGEVNIVIYTCNRERNYLRKTLEYLVEIRNLSCGVHISHGGESLVEQNLTECKVVLKKFLFSDLNLVENQPDWDVRRRAQENYINALLLDTYPIRENVYRLILEDDVRASVKLNSLLDNYIDLVKQKEGDKPFILSLYTPYIPLRSSTTLKVYNIEVDSFYGLQACMFSEELCKPFADFIRERIATEPHDFLIKDFCKQNNINIWAVSHSLFQHIGELTTGLGHHHTTGNFYDDVFLKNQPSESISAIPARTDKKRLLIWCEYLCRTGFSTVAKNIAKILKDQYEIWVVDFTHAAKSQDYEGVKIIGKLDDFDTFGEEQILRVIEHVDALLIINDVWNIDKMLENLKLSGKKLPPIITYFPVDAINHTAHWYKHFDIVKSPVTYTNFAYGVVQEAVKGFVNQENGEELMKKLSVIPHGVDDTVFYPIADKKEVRRKLFKSDKFDNSFIVLNANRNQPRKRLDITMRAFAMFMEVNLQADAYLYMHSAIVDQSLNIYHLAKQLKIADRLILSVPLDKPKQRPNATDEDMNLIYNACDVGINTSMGEGFGLCSVEHAMTGAIQIVPCHSACMEIFSSAEASMISIAEDYMFDHVMTIGSLPSLHSAFNEICNLYANRDSLLMKHKKQLTLDKFINNKTAWSWSGIIAEAWKYVIAEAVGDRNASIVSVANVTEKVKK